MLVLWIAKVEAAVVLDSSVLLADAACSLGCIQLSLILALGSALFLAHASSSDDENPLWWVDAVAALAIALLLLREGVQICRHSMRRDFAGQACDCHTPSMAPTTLGDATKGDAVNGEHLARYVSSTEPPLELR